MRKPCRLWGIPSFRHREWTAWPGKEFWRYYPENTPSYVGVRTDRYKYIEFERGRNPWLFDLEMDPKELNNLYGKPEAKKALSELKALLEGLKIKRIGSNLKN